MTPADLPVPYPLLTFALIIAWRIFARWKDAHEASRYWRIGTAVPWASLLLAIDLAMVLGALFASQPLAELAERLGLPGGFTMKSFTGPTTLVTGLAASALVRRRTRVTRRHARLAEAESGQDVAKTTLQQYILGQIEYACYDKADDWIYRVVYPAITDDRTKPFLYAIRGYLESRPTELEATRTEDASFVGQIIRAEHERDNTVPDGDVVRQENVRAACHRMLKRRGRRRLATLVAEHSATRKAHRPPHPAEAGRAQSIGLATSLEQVAHTQVAPEAWTIEAYEAYVGRWSRLVAVEFQRRLGVPAGRRWLDVGCGTGALTAAVLAKADPTEVVALDTSDGFLGNARSRVNDNRVTFRLGDAQSLPLADGEFDAVVSGLVLNLVSDPGAAVAEFARVAHPHGVVAAYLWDYAEGMAMIRHFWDAATTLDPDCAHLDEANRFPLCRPERMRGLWREVGLTEVTTGPIDIKMTFATFDEFWGPFLGGQGPAPGYTMSLTEDHRTALRDLLEERLPAAAEGSIELTARAWAVRGAVPARRPLKQNGARGGGVPGST